MFCLLQSHVSHERQMPYYSWISFHSQYHAPLSATPSVKCNRDYRSTLPVQLDWAQTSQPSHVNNDWWWCLEHGIPHGPPDWKFLAVLLYCKLAGGWLSSPHWHGRGWGHGNVCGFEDCVLVSVVFLYPLLLGIQHWKETFVAEMPEMEEVVRNEDKRVGSLLFGYAGQSPEWHHWLTSMPALDLNLILPFVQLPSAQTEFTIL